MRLPAVHHCNALFSQNGPFHSILHNSGAQAIAIPVVDTYSYMLMVHVSGLHRLVTSLCDKTWALEIQSPPVRRTNTYVAGMFKPQNFLCKGEQQKMLYMCISTYIGNAELNIQEEQANWQALFSSKSKPYVIECYFVSRHFCGWTYNNCLNFNNSWFTYLLRLRF